MPAVWFIVDPTHPDWVAAEPAMEAATAAKYNGTLMLGIRDGHAANRKLVKANITEAERVGDLAPFVRSLRGQGVYIDEYVSIDHHQAVAFEYLDEAGGRRPLFRRERWVFNGSDDYVEQSNRGDGTGLTYGDAKAGLRTVNGPGSEHPAPAANTTEWWCGFHIAVADGSGTVAGLGDVQTINGNSESDPFRIRFDDPLDPGRVTNKLMWRHRAWVDNGDGSYTIDRRETGGSAYLNWNGSGIQRGYFDLDLAVDDFNGQLEKLASKAAVGSYVPSAGLGATHLGGDEWTVKLPGGANPQGRAFFPDFGYRPPIDGEFIEYYGFKARAYSHAIAPGSGTVRKLKFKLGDFSHTTSGYDIKYASGAYGFGVDVNGAPNGVVEDIEIWAPFIERQKNAVYLIAQSPDDIGIMRRITIHGRLTGNDLGGAVAEEGDNDGHILGVQNADDVHCDEVFGRRVGNAISAYRRNNAQVPVRTFNNLTIGTIDVAEFTPFYPGAASPTASCGLNLTGDNDATVESTGWRFGFDGGVKVHGYDTIIGNRLLHGIRCQNEYEPEIFDPDIALCANASVVTSRSHDPGSGIITGTINLKNNSGNRGRIEKGADGVCVIVATGASEGGAGPGAGTGWYFKHANIDYVGGASDLIFVTSAGLFGSQTAAQFFANTPVSPNIYAGGCARIET